MLITSVPNGLNPAMGYLMYTDLSHDHLYTPKSLQDSLIAAGFDAIAVHPDGPVPYDFPTTVRWGLWKIRELFLKAMFIIDVGVGRANRLQLIFPASIIATAHKEAEGV